ncbi:MAG TPA: hypothetical protein VI653_29925, partial [Steroidobacteraceae bacterium]
LAGLDVEQVKIDLSDMATAQHLGLGIWRTHQGVSCQLGYSTALYMPATIEALAHHFETLLVAVIAEKDDQPIRRLCGLAVGR